MSAAAGAAAGMAIFNMYTEKRKIKAQNDAAAAAYQATEAALTFAQGNTWNRAAQAADEYKRISAGNIREAKVQIDQKGSTIAMSEGITAGASKARQLQSFFQQTSEALGKEVQKTESVVNKIAMSAEETNWQYQNQKVQAYQNMKSSLVTGNNARLQILGAGINGASTGYSLGSAVGGMRGPADSGTMAQSGGMSSEYDTSGGHTTSRQNW